MTDFTVEMAGPAPALNTTYKIATRRNAAGRTYSTLVKRDGIATWQDSVAWLTKAARPKGWQAARRVLISIEWYSPRKRDCDAGVKAALDAVAVGLGVDDSCFLLQVLVNEIDKVNPRTVIRISNEA